MLGLLDEGHLPLPDCLPETPAFAIAITLASLTLDCSKGASSEPCAQGHQLAPRLQLQVASLRLQMQLLQMVLLEARKQEAELQRQVANQS